MIRVVVIGIGMMGKKYAKMIDQGLVEGMQLCGVCARSKENLEWTRANLSSQVHFFATIDEVFLNCKEFDAIIIATPHALHPQIAIQAFEHKKHVLCDKPAGITVLQAKQMNQAAVQSKMVYGLIFHNRTYPLYQKMKELLQNGSIGEILRISCINNSSFRTRHYHQSESWRSSFSKEGGGALINQGQHLLDLWQWLFGMPESVKAKIPFGKYNSFLVDDEVTMLLSYPNQLNATFVLTTGEAFSTDRLEVVGTRGRLVACDNTLTYEWSTQDSRDYGKTAKVNSKEQFIIETKVMQFERPENPYFIMLQNFVASVEGREELIAPGTDGERALELANAAYLSAWNDEEIRFPMDGAEYERQLKQQCLKEHGC